MQQSEQIFRFRLLLGTHFAGRDDVLVSGGATCRVTRTEWPSV